MLHDYKNESPSICRGLLQLAVILLSTSSLQCTSTKYGVLNFSEAQVTGYEATQPNTLEKAKFASGFPCQNSEIVLA
ncbi:hypothetical protein BDW62DRAFT_58986 [Aspergillus aurantiobrunneus]